MPDFRLGYNAPGVYVEEVNTPVISVTGVPPTLVAILGPSQGFFRHVETVTLTGVVAVRLAKKGIDTASVVVTRVDTSAVAAAADYTLTTVGTLATRDYSVDVVRSGTSTLPTPVTVTVAYRYTPPDYFEPKRFENYEDVKDSYGEPLNLNAPVAGQPYIQIPSPLSLAAKVAFENGADELVLVATTPPPAAATPTQVSASLRAALVAAYAKIVSNYAINIVVPVTDGIVEADASGALVELRAHLEAASNDGFFRTGVVGFDPGFAAAPDQILGTSGARSKRITFPYVSASGLNFYNGGSNQTLSLGNQYLSAALAGRRAGVPIQKSLTREVIRSFAGVAGAQPTNSQRNQYAAAGIAVCETDRLGRLVVRHDVTTDNAGGINNSEASVVRARDALVTLIQVGTDEASLVGQPIDDDTLLAVKGVMAGLLETAKGERIIVGYTDLVVRLRVTNPTVVEVRFAYRPAYPLNYIVISFAVNVATGEVAINNET